MTIAELIAKEERETTNNGTQTTTETSDTKVDTNGQLQTDSNTDANINTEETQNQTAQNTEEENSTSFTMPSFEAEKTQTAQQNKAGETNNTNQEIAWQEVVKKVDRKELLKELYGDDFVYEIAEHRKNGGDTYSYIEAKSMNWDRVGDVDMIRNDFREQFPNFSNDEIERLVAKKYGLTGDEDNDADGLLLLKADAHVKREIKKKDASNFKISDAPQRQQETNTQNDIANIQEQQRQRSEQIKDYFNGHESTKSLVESKRVAVKLGDNVFNVNIDKPELVNHILTTPEAWQKVTSNAQGEPDVQKLQRIALVALMGDDYETNIFNYGRKMGKREMVTEGNHATRDFGKAPNGNVGQSTGIVVKGSGTVKQHLG